MTASAPERIAYGPAPSQFAEVWSPGAGVAGRVPAPWPVAVVLHGGYWRDRYDLHLMDGLCSDLAARGWLAVNVEYRRVGADGGGWPATFDDVTAAVGLARAGLRSAEGGRVVAIGHSAGGHLALWAAATAVTPLAGVVALAPVSDLHEASRRGLSDHAVHGLLGGAPAEHPDRYGAADPMRHLPLGCPTLVVHGTADVNVPIDLSRAYVAAASSAGDDVTFHELEGGDHFVVIDPSSAAWQGVGSWLSPIATMPSPSTSPTRWPPSGTGSSPPNPG